MKQSDLIKDINRRDKLKELRDRARLSTLKLYTLKDELSKELIATSSIVSLLAIMADEKVGEISDYTLISKTMPALKDTNIESSLVSTACLENFKVMEKHVVKNIGNSLSTWLTSYLARMPDKMPNNIDIARYYLDNPKELSDESILVLRDLVDRLPTKCKEFINSCSKPLHTAVLEAICSEQFYDIVKPIMENHKDIVMENLEVSPTDANHLVVLYNNCIVLTEQINAYIIQASLHDLLYK